MLQIIINILTIVVFIWVFLKDDTKRNKEIFTQLQRQIDNIHTRNTKDELRIRDIENWAISKGYRK